MSNLSNTQKKKILGFLLALFFTWIIDVIPSSMIHLYNLSTILYGCLIIVWALTIRERIVEKHIRHFLLSGAIMLVLLFVLRICRWKFFQEFTPIAKYLWYAYYIPFVATPLLSLSAALCVDRTVKDKPIFKVAPLWVIAGILCIGILTNDLHRFMFRIELHTPEMQTYTYGPLYYITVIWCVSVTVAAFVILMRRCRLSMSRKLWYIPVLLSSFYLVLLIVYYVAGGSPYIGRFRLYNIQEVYSFLYLFFWESCIQIGLIPSNSNYENIFIYSPLTVCISDDANNIIYHARDAVIPKAEQIGRVLKKPVMITDNLRMNSSRIQNGFVIWNEDLSFLNELRDEIRETADRIAEENTLLEYENKTKEERAKVETQNRLYDETAVCVRPQLKKLNGLIQAAKANPDEEAHHIAKASVIGAYIKRRSNLAIIAQDNQWIDIEELYFSIRESLEYVSLSGIINDVHISGTRSVPSGVLIFFYELFEEIVESLLDSTASLMINLSAQDGFQMNIMIDAAIDFSALQSREYRGIKLNITHEDDAQYITVSYIEGGDRA